MAENHSLDENVTPNSEVDQYWADLLSVCSQIGIGT